MGLRFNAFVTLSFWLLYITGTSDVHFDVAARRQVLRRHRRQLGVRAARRSALGVEGWARKQPIQHGSDRVPATFNTDETWALPTHNPAHIRCA